MLIVQIQLAQPPLHLACDNGHTETASALIGNGAK
jgi:hypothetical protein